MAHKYTQEQRDFIKKNYKGISSLELALRFNEEFGTNLTKDQLRWYKKNHKLPNGLDAKFKKGNIPYNKGTKGIVKPNKTSFKKGNIPPNHRPIGSERINIDGYTEVKVGEPNKWKFKHRIIWEEKFGVIPRGHAVMFADRNKQNFEIDNLILVSTRQLQIMNNKKLIQDDADLTKTGLVIANVLIKIADKKK